MRFMVIIKADKKSEAGILPTQETKKTFAAMGKFNEQLAKAGVMLAGEGLQPSSKGKRVRFSGQQRTVIDGPFSEAKEVVGGFAILEFKSKEEAIEGALQFMELHRKFWPGWEGETEVRQVLGPEAFAPEA